ncbi:DegQ family serine endoprotease [Aminobacterium sp. MB27-C1]|uniref:DegQ family serine endoprotease n=1 Tax=Aminobacterium sp. MB27-C1 TaxID=3070661 RepID=UPI0027DE1743|nr:DegQ family serine endoprotease [Aminobacterium sp. MB27-C1]WMI70552.1 DegQ family serine endoprotease [Aminobacterium sp. MB27-C1]
MKNIRNTIAFLALVAFVLGMLGAPSFAQDVFSGNPVAAIAKDASPAVVNIDVETMVTRSVSPFPDDPIFRHFFGEEFQRFSRTIPMKGRGSGFIVSEEGQILTNNHVVEGADKITVTLSDGRTFSAKVLGTDPTFDLAVIKIDANHLPVLKLGDSDRLDVGEWVVAIGNPFGLEHTVTVGVISAKNRSIHAGDVNFDGFLQTDAAINPGNSGGPLINLSGEVVGINSAIVPYAQGIGFAIPINMAKQVMNDLVKYGKVKRGWLGVYVQPLTKEFASAYGIKEEKGAVISDVVPDSPAAKAGLQRGDVIVSVNGNKIENHQDLVFRIRQSMAGDAVTLNVIRKGKKEDFSVKLTEVSSAMEEDIEGQSSKNSEMLRKAGLEVSNVTTQLRSRYNLQKNDGVVVTSVEPGSFSARAGIREGDLILEVNGTKVDSVNHLEKVLGKKDDSLVLLLARGSRTFFVSMSF